MKELIKQDINFLEYNMWFQDEVLANKTTNGYIWEDREGYFYKCGYKLPVKVDFIFLLWLLKQSQDEGWKEEIEFTRYNILKGCDIPVSKPKYDRVVDSFKRWFNVKIQYEGTFYDGKSYQSINFGIIEMVDNRSITNMNHLCEITSSKRIYAADYQSEGVPFYRGKEIIEKHNGSLGVSTELFISESKFVEVKSKFGRIFLFIF